MWPFGKRKSRTSQALGPLVRARFDAAVTNVENARHWANADGLSADAAASPDVRQTLRNRARYEAANNSYARGIVLTLANDCVGTGPRLQVRAGVTPAPRPNLRCAHPPVTGVPWSVAVVRSDLSSSRE